MRSHLRTFTLFTLLAGSMALGQTADAPRTPSAIDAKAKYDFAVKQAHEAFVKTELTADQAYIEALGKAEDEAMKGGLNAKPEADRLDAARIAAVNAMEQHKSDKSDAPANTNWFVGTKWLYEKQRGTVIQYLPGGVATGTPWHGQGKWMMVDSNTLVQTEPEGNVIRVNFTADHKAALWQYQNNGDIHIAIADYKVGSSE